MLLSLVNEIKQENNFSKWYEKQNDPYNIFIIGKRCRNNNQLFSRKEFFRKMIDQGLQVLKATFTGTETFYVIDFGCFC